MMISDLNMQNSFNKPRVCSEYQQKGINDLKEDISDRFNKYFYS